MHLSTELSTAAQMAVDNLFHISYETDKLCLHNYIMPFICKKAPVKNFFAIFSVKNKLFYK